jgi:hypothetical protein
MTLKEKLKTHEVLIHRSQEDSCFLRSNYSNLLKKIWSHLTPRSDQPPPPTPTMWHNKTKCTGFLARATIKLVTKAKLDIYISYGCFESLVVNSQFQEQSIFDKKKSMLINSISFKNNVILVMPCMYFGDEWTQFKQYFY